MFEVLCIIGASVLCSPGLIADQPEQFPEPEVGFSTEEPPLGMFGRYLQGWTGSVELGITGSSGNVERFSGRGGVRAERRTELYESKGELTYIFARTDGDTSQNEAHLLLRTDRLFIDSPWRIFGIGMADYDEFKDWDVRLAAFLGVGYAFIQDDRTQLIGRLGAGVKREIGGEENAFVPEGLIGVDFEQRITERQRVIATFDFFPELREFGPYRFIGRAAWEILVDPAVNLSLRIGAESRYDSTPGLGVKRHDLDYFATVVWSF